MHNTLLGHPDYIIFLLLTLLNIFSHFTLRFPLLRTLAEAQEETLLKTSLLFQKNLKKWRRNKTLALNSVFNLLI